MRCNRLTKRATESESLPGLSSTSQSEGVAPLLPTCNDPVDESQIAQGCERLKDLVERAAILTERFGQIVHGADGLAV